MSLRTARASRTVGSSSVVGHAAGVAAALAALDHHRVRAPAGHLLRVARGTDRRDHDDAGVLEPRDQVRLRGQGERRHLHPVPDQELAAFGCVAGVGAQVHPERLVGALLHLEDRALQLVVRHRGAGQDAEPAGVGGAGHQARPGDPAHPGLHDGVPHAGQLGERGAQRAGRSCRGLQGDLLVAETLRVQHLADDDQLVEAGGAGLGRPCRRWRSHPDCSRTSSTVTPGCTDSRRRVSSGPPRSRTPRLVTIRWMSLKRRRRRPPPSRARGPTPETTSTCSTNVRGGVLRDPVADVRLFTVLPGAPRTPSSCRFGLSKSPIAEMFWLPCRSTWVAPIITCRLP